VLQAEYNRKIKNNLKLSSEKQTSYRFSNHVTLRHILDETMKDVVKNQPAYPLSFGIIHFGKFYFFLRLTMFFSISEYLSRMLG